ncbi:hypothetical protein JXA40_08595 [bacterium]|nr:hypothetical protein [candidate division CSSED10-310 bacterium]
MTIQIFRRKNRFFWLLAIGICLSACSPGSGPSSRKLNLPRPEDRSATVEAETTARKLAEGFTIVHSEASYIGPERTPGYKIFFIYEGDETHVGAYLFRNDYERDSFLMEWEELTASWSGNTGGQMAPDNFIFSDKLLIQTSIKAPEPLLAILKDRFEVLTSGIEPMESPDSSGISGLLSTPEHKSGLSR